MNVCGGCSLCCKLTAVPELRKPVNKWCDHSPSLNSGCRIYHDEKRPPSCRNFRCIWLTGGLGPDLRPDKCHVVFERLNRHVYLALADPDHPLAWNEAPVLVVIKSFVQAGRSIVAGSGPGNPRKVFTPPWKKPENVLFEVFTLGKAMGMV